MIFDIGTIQGDLVAIIVILCLAMDSVKMGPIILVNTRGAFGGPE